MPTVNELLLDEAIRHQVQLAKYSNEVVRKLIAVLNRSDARLRSALLTALENETPDTFKAERLTSLLASVRVINAQAYAQVGTALQSELLDFSGYEAAYQANALMHNTPVQVHIASVTVEQVHAAAMSRPFQGLLLKDALSETEATRARRVRNAVAQGYVEGRTTDQIVREIMGTKKNQYADGLLEMSRRDVQAITRTALSHTAATAHDAVLDENADVLEAIEWSATLDLRTSEICRIRDGKKYAPKTHKPIGHSLPWLGGPGRAHWNCRSASVPVVKSLEELLGLPNETTTRGGTRASMDGQVPKEMNYADWLKKQSYERQTEVLGPTRAKLMKEGKLPLERMYGLRGQFLTLDQLRASDAAAFKRAGL